MSKEERRKEWLKVYEGCKARSFYITEGSFGWLDEVSRVGKKSFKKRYVEEIMRKKIEKKDMGFVPLLSEWEKIKKEDGSKRISLMIDGKLWDNWEKLCGKYNLKGAKGLSLLILRSCPKVRRWRS